MRQQHEHKVLIRPAHLLQTLWCLSGTGDFNYSHYLHSWNKVARWHWTRLSGSRTIILAGGSSFPCFAHLSLPHLTFFYCTLSRALFLSSLPPFWVKGTRRVNINHASCLTLESCHLLSALLSVLYHMNRTAIQQGLSLRLVFSLFNTDFVSEE